MNIAICGDPEVLVIEAGREYAVALEPDAEVIVVTVGEQGPPGPPGPSGGSARQRLAGESVSALRVVYEVAGNVYPLDYRDDAHIDLLLGISLTAAPAGGALNIQRSGVLEDAAWSWAPGRLYLSASGSLTQTPPADGFLVLIGAATSATSITLNLQDPIDLEN
jgi:hypothetical protein